MATKGEKRRDRALYGRLIESYQADRISIFIDFDHLNAPKSPVFGPCENGAPLPIIILLVTGAMVLLDLLLRTLTMALGVLVYLFWSTPGYRKGLTDVPSTPPRTIFTTGMSCGNWAASLLL
jgi:hypothetical protein